MKKRFTVTLNPDLVKKAKILAICNDTNFSAIVEKMLTDYLKEYEEGRRNNGREYSKNSRVSDQS